MDHNLFSEVYISQVATGVTGSTEIRYSTGVNMLSPLSQGVAFIIDVTTTSTATTGLTAHIGMSSSSGFGSEAVVYGSTVAMTTTFVSDQCLLVSDVYRPVYQWVRAVVTNTTNNEVLNGITALQYRLAAEAASYSTGSVAEVEINIGSSS